MEHSINIDSSLGIPNEIHAGGTASEKETSSATTLWEGFWSLLNKGNINENFYICFNLFNSLP